MTEELILASASPTRASLLATAGVEVRVEPAAVDEEAVKQTYRAKGHAAVECALALAEAKARRVAGRLVCDGLWFDKPSDLGAARAQLKALRGRTHELATAACVVQNGTRIWHTVKQPHLTMREFSDLFLENYLAMEEAAVLGTVGAYRLEGRGLQLFERVEGDYFAILGLPLLELLGFLRERGQLAS